MTELKTGDIIYTLTDHYTQATWHKRIVVAITYFGMATIKTPYGKHTVHIPRYIEVTPYRLVNPTELQKLFLNVNLDENDLE